MESKKNCTILSLYSENKNQKGTLCYISFKFICLSLYVIGFYYVFLNTSLENKGLQIVNIRNVYERNLGEAQKNSNGPQRKRNLKLKNEDVNKTKSNGNIKSNEEKVEENKDCTNNDMKNDNVENKSNSSMNNINYNDMSKTLTEKELFDVLNSFEECPAKENLRNIWNHAVGIAKEGVDDIQRELKGLIQKYLDNDVCDERGDWLYETIWKRNLFSFCDKISTEEVKYTKNFYNLINGKHTIDDILKFIYSFLEHFKTLKKELHQKHHKELLESIAQNVRSF
ncbi:exported protein (PHISTa) [Plasmodium gaboni]|uniref:Exported protein (PHISTa) n=1 Tax=Plasmodium gaboni TaxID=647221 RepID=A0A151L2E1_9APIC|nr:exported protein (PHISTa) [Plasmodium gaboni]KYN93110.1 exported protein (PHISTa) [Plasmodium gaboni]